ncbi:hypothetical protein I3842_14G033600 [Carya illinoinensis]|uniref:DUF4219 domain-containing protein n=1 Tax=Carya illinoinensis TaxID=32201 RepID=A0A922AIT7_CARIL|nr:hypothetical protein I3842_14G033600 [Carya illinoinensis]
METKSTAFSAAVPIPELLDKYNYAKWAILVRTYLEGQDLWEDIINDNENATAAPSQKENDDEDAIKVRRRRNFMALHVIQTSCGPDAFSQISTVRSADTAWQTLKMKYLPAGESVSLSQHCRPTARRLHFPTAQIISDLQYADLYRAVRRGDLTALREFLDSQPRAVSKAITNKGETALHIAIAAGHAHIVEELVRRRMSEEDLGIADGEGYTAPMLVLVYGISELKHHFPLSSLKDMVLAENGCKGAMLLTRAIYTGNFDLAFELISSYPNLTLALDDRGESPFLALASMPQAFKSGNRLGFWKRRIYSSIQLTDQSTARFTNDTRLDINNEGHFITTGLAPAALLRHLVPRTFRKYLLVLYTNNLFGISRLLHQIKQLRKELYEMKKMDIQSEKLLSLMSSEISRSLRETGGQLENIGGVYDAINRAVKNGIPEFVSAIVPMDPRFLEHKDRDSRNLLLLAVLYRQYEIFRLIYGLDKYNILASSRDRNDDNVYIWQE